MTAAAIEVLEQLENWLGRVEQSVFVEPVRILSGATVGQHVRHILESFECLANADATVDYEARPRDICIEQNPTTALRKVQWLKTALENGDRPLSVKTSYDDAPQIGTTYFRELQYNIDHCVHHQAQIRTALLAVEWAGTLPESFGVAPSTLRYRAQIRK